MSAKNKSSELQLTRVYDAPVKAVWDAWTDPEQTKQWWGPRGHSITHHGKDLRAGGYWHYTMHGPDGQKWETKTKYLEVVPYEKLVYDHGGNDEQPPLFRVTVLFSEKRGKTTMVMTMALPSPEAMEQTKKVIKNANGHSTWDRLAEHLAKHTAGKDAFVITRSFHTDVETMFEMWTDPKHVAQWLGPAGVNLEYRRCDIRTGGSAVYSMAAPGGPKMWGKCEYLKVQKPELLVYTQQFCDEHEKTARHPMAPTWPETMLTTVQFTAEDSDHVRVTITWETQGKVTAEELATFLKERGGMTQGWTGSLDKLEAYLEKK